MEEINIKDFFSYLKNYIVAFVVCIVLAVGGMVVYDKMFKQPIYQAQTTVIIAKANYDNESNGSAATLNDINASQKLVTTYSEIAKSELVLNRVINNLGLNTSVKSLEKDLTIKPVDNTAVLSIAVRGVNAKMTASIANEIAKVFSEQVRDIYKVENVTQLAVATTPETAINNNMTRDIVLATIVAVGVVAAFAFLKFYLDDTVKSTDDLEKKLGLPITGKILKSEIKITPDTGELIVQASPKAIVSENIKSLRTNLQFTAVDKSIKTILVTSTNASEGKTFVSSNLAISFAQADKKVLLVDCDLRKGRVHKLFGLTNTNGLSNLLTSDLRSPSKYINRTKLRNLDVITSGTYPPNPSELLASKKNKKLIKMLSDHYDIVIFDGAPIGGLADSVILSSFMDKTLIVAKDSGTTKADLAAVKDALDKVGANIAGVALNMVDRRASKYAYYYSNEPTKKK